MFHNLQLYLAYRHIKVCDLIRHIICESLMEIQHFRHKWSLIMLENSQKGNKIKVRSINCSDIWHTSKYVYWLGAHSVKVKCWSFFDISPSNIGHCFQPAQTKSLLWSLKSLIFKNCANSKYLIQFKSINLFSLLFKLIYWFPIFFIFQNSDNLERKIKIRKYCALPFDFTTLLVVIFECISTSFNIFSFKSDYTKILYLDSILYRAIPYLRFTILHSLKLLLLQSIYFFLVFKNFIWIRTNFLPAKI